MSYRSEQARLRKEAELDLERLAKMEKAAPTSWLVYRQIAEFLDSRLQRGQIVGNERAEIITRQALTTVHEMAQRGVEIPAAMVAGIYRIVLGAWVGENIEQIEKAVGR